MKKALLVLFSLVLCGCQTESGVGNKVLQDFGLQERPEGYISSSDRVTQNLDAVAATEMKRMNQAERKGEILFEEEGTQGRYYRKVKIYEKYYPIDARPSTTQGNEDSKAYTGTISYAFRMYESARTKTRTEAMTTSANIETEETGRETYRYNFDSIGHWDGRKGQKTRR